MQTFGVTVINRVALAMSVAPITHIASVRPERIERRIIYLFASHGATSFDLLENNACVFIADFISVLYCGIGDDKISPQRCAEAVF